MMISTTATISQARIPNVRRRGSVVGGTRIAGHARRPVAKGRVGRLSGWSSARRGRLGVDAVARVHVGVAVHDRAPTARVRGRVLLPGGEVLAFASGLERIVGAVGTAATGRCAPD